MDNEQEQAIAIIQQMMNHCIHEKLWALEDTLERKAEVLTSIEMAEIERSEYIRTLDELADIYAKNPVVRSIKNYMHLPNFLWESTFIESLTMGEKRKWFRSQSLATYDDFCKDNSVFDQAFPYFSIIYQVVVNEQYAVFLKQRIEGREQKTWNYEIPKSETKETNTKKEENNLLSTNEYPDRYTFEHTLTDAQIDSLVDCVNEVRMFKGPEITFKQLKSIFDCQPITPLKSSNNRLLAFFFDQLSNRSYITENWQTVIARNHLFLSPQKNTFLNQNDIATAVHDVRDSDIKGRLGKIIHYIKNLKSLSE